MLLYIVYNKCNNEFEVNLDTECTTSLTLLVSTLNLLAKQHAHDLLQNKRQNKHTQMSYSISYRSHKRSFIFAVSFQEVCMVRLGTYVLYAS